MAVRDMIGGDGLRNVKFMIWISGPVFSVCAAMAREEFRDVSLGVCVCLLVAWTASHCNGHTHSPFPSLRPGRKVISSGGFCWLGCCLFTFQSPPRRVSWADRTGLKFNSGASFQLSPCPDSFLQVQLAHRSRFTDSCLQCCHFRFLNKN